MKAVRPRLRSLLMAFTALVLASAACDTSSLFGMSDETSASATPPPTWTAVVPTETAEPTEAVTNSPVPATATVTHILAPGEPPGVRRFVSDVNSSSRAAQRSVTGGDNYLRNRFERPFSAGSMDYQPAVDITRAEVTFDDTWFYFTVELADADPATGALLGTYAIELDFNRDGRGDWLILAEAPSSFNWSTDGVRVLLDINGDVGGNTAMTADDSVSFGDGFETELFNNGIGDDPDAAWARRAPSSSNSVQMAVKRDFLRSLSFLWGAWADAGLNDPGMFDYVDRFTESQAGSPIEGSADFPLKEVAAVDNTCRMYQGFTPTGSEPGICIIFATVQNCTFHPMLMTPGDEIIGGQQTGSSIKTDVLPGTYNFYDQNVLDNDDNHPLILTVTLRAGDSVQIVKDGNEMTWSCP